MKKRQPCESFTFAPARSLTGGSAGGFSFLKMACFVLAFCTAAATVSPAQTFTTLASVSDTNSGPNPLAQGTDGNFYGTSLYGGSGIYGGVGSVFRVTPKGKVTGIYAFDSADGQDPSADALVLGTDGDFYGTTLEGGPKAFGTVFKITGAGALTTLFGFNGPDGYFPNGLVQSTADGNFYGITSWGGASGNCPPSACGTVFKINSEGALTTLHSFDGTDGEYPNALVQGTDGNFYGTTLYGGANSLPACTRNGFEVGCGTVFKITPEGTLTTLHSFDVKDGALPEALIQASNGDFYGTTAFGGHIVCSQGLYGCGTLFKITARGTLTTLHTFNGTDGFYANRLVQATDGNFYGTTTSGGAYDTRCASGCGTVFEITPGGTLTTLHNFCAQTNCPDGSDPNGLLQGTNGTFYGTTPEGGAYSMGVVYSLSVGLGAFVETVPTSSKVGASVIIVGNNLTGTTSVSFNGTAATFTVLSNTEITATVPTGATTGTVEVTTPKTTLKSNTQFRVTP
jgi:uncharacterized repeat protein (TIGR03803 family)